MRAGGGSVPDLRGRLGWLLLVRLVLVSAFLAAALLQSPRDHPAGPNVPVVLIALGYGATAISGLFLPRVRRVVVYAGIQVAFDLVLVSLAVVATGGLDSPMPVLFNLVILNAALLRLGPGISVTALAASLLYGIVLASLAAANPQTVRLPHHVVTHAINILSFCALAALARYLSKQVAAAEDLLVARQEELGRIETLQLLVANAVDNGLVLTDGTGRITSANPTAAEILELDPVGSIGTPLESKLPGVAELLLDAPPTELVIGDANGARHLLRVKAAAVTDTYHQPIGRLYIVQDVTTVREMEARLREEERIEAYTAVVRPQGDAPVTVFEGLVGESEAMRRVFALIEKVASTESTVLITGESGTGKELVARALHARSPRAAHPFVAVNCGAIPETLIESELFGHVRGAFTGAVADRTGLFRQAHGGTIFLDEIGELPLGMQVRLLRVLQDRQLTPVGGSAVRSVDVRVVAATNRDLERLVSEGRFREDLYYRLNVIRIATPSLRERPADVPLLLLHLLRKCSERYSKAVERVSPRTMRLLANYGYPGNVRELENIVDHAVTLCEGDTLTENDLPAHLVKRAQVAPSQPTPATPATPVPNEDPQPLASAPPLFDGGRSLDDLLATYEKDMIVAALDRVGGVRKRAAELLGIKYRSLRHRLSKYGLAPGDDDDDDAGAIHPA